MVDPVLQDHALAERRHEVDGEISVCVCAGDPISRAGVVAQLEARPEVRVVDDDDVGSASVSVVVAEHVDRERSSW